MAKKKSAKSTRTKRQTQQRGGSAGSSRSSAGSSASRSTSKKNKKTTSRSSKAGASSKSSKKKSTRSTAGGTRKKTKSTTKSGSAATSRGSRSTKPGSASGGGSSRKKTTRRKAGSTGAKSGSAGGSKSSGKGRRNRLSRSDLVRYKKMLLLRRAELLGDIDSMSREALENDAANLSHMPMHMADAGSDAYEQEFMLGLVQSERQMLGEIEEALQRIAEGTYGVCEATGKPIAKARLEVKPWAKYCIEAARQMESSNGPPNAGRA